MAYSKPGSVLAFHTPYDTVEYSPERYRMVSKSISQRKHPGCQNNPKAPFLAASRASAGQEIDKTGIVIQQKPRFIANVFFSGAMDPDNFHLEITNLAVSSRAELGRFQRSGEIPVPAATGARLQALFGDGGCTDHRFCTEFVVPRYQLLLHFSVSPASATQRWIEYNGILPRWFQGNSFRDDIHPQEGKKVSGLLEDVLFLPLGPKKISICMYNCKYIISIRT